MTPAHSAGLVLTTPSDREIVLTRTFNAPRHLVFDALSKPELVKRWFGPRVLTLTVCEIDLRPGGKYRYVLSHPDGRTMGMGGVYREVERPESVVCTEVFDDFPPPPGEEAVLTSVLTERDGQTTLTATVVYASREIRDAVLQSGMEGGAAESYDRLAELLAELT